MLARHSPICKPWLARKPLNQTPRQTNTSKIQSNPETFGLFPFPNEGTTHSSKKITRTRFCSVFRHFATVSNDVISLPGKRRRRPRRPHSRSLRVFPLRVESCECVGPTYILVSRETNKKSKWFLFKPTQSGFPESQPRVVPKTTYTQSHMERGGRAQRPRCTKA